MNIGDFSKFMIGFTSVIFASAIVIDVATPGTLGGAFKPRQEAISDADLESGAWVYCGKGIVHERKNSEANEAVREGSLGEPTAEDQKQAGHPPGDL